MSEQVNESLDSISTMATTATTETMETLATVATVATVQTMATEEMATTAATAATVATTSLLPVSSGSATFKPTSLIPAAVTLTIKHKNFRDNVISLAKFFEENQHYSVPKSQKKLFQFCKNMRTAIRNRKEGVSSHRRLVDAQYKILRDIKFVDHTVELDKGKKQRPLTKSFRNILLCIDDFKQQNGHLDILHPDANFIKKVKRKDGTFHDTNSIVALQNAFRLLKSSKLGKDRKMKLREKGIDLDIDSAETRSLVASNCEDEGLESLEAIESEEVVNESESETNVTKQSVDRSGFVAPSVPVDGCEDERAE